MSGSLHRRALLRGAVGLASQLLLMRDAWALGRTPFGGELELSVPFAMSSLDLHALDDPAALLFAEAIAEPVYAMDTRGRVYPTLAQELPRKTAAGVEVELRPNLVSAHGRALDGRDLQWALDRARLTGGRPSLIGFGRPETVAGKPYAVRYRKGTASQIAAALTTPLAALTPRHVSAKRPDGTGPFKATIGAGALTLQRNLRAARGPAQLERVVVRGTSTLSDALRAFEAKRSDIGWLGPGLHKKRPGAVKLNAGARGFVVLKSGPQAAGWGAPGVAQQLADAVDAGVLERFDLGPRPPRRGKAAWGGPPVELLVASDSAYLVEIAEVLGEAFSRPGHEITVRALPRGDFDRRLKSRRFGLALDVVRFLGPTAELRALGLVGAADSALARKPPRFPNPDPRVVARTLPLGVVGELRVSGYQVPGIRQLETWRLGEVWRG